MTRRPGRRPGLTPDGERFRALRLQAGLSVAELARRMGGRDVSTIHKLEAGTLGPVSELLVHQAAREFAAALNRSVPVDELIRQEVAA